MQTTDNVQTGTGPGTSTTYTTYSNPSYNAEKGWECPRCGRINAPWVRQCDCSRSNWTWTDKPTWWQEVTCNSDTCNVHPNPTVATNVNQVVGGSDYKDSATGNWVNVPKTYTNSIKR